MSLKKSKRQSVDEWTADTLAQQMAPVCRDAYIMARRIWGARTGDRNEYKPGTHWDGGMHRGKEYKSIWPRIANFMLKHRLNPFMAVRTVFDTAVGSRNPPFPNMLLSTNYLADYEIAKLQARNEVRGQLESNIAYARTQIHFQMQIFKRSHREAVLDIVLSPQSHLSELFRYCLAHAEGYDGTADKYLPRAIMQYAGLEDVYTDLWKKWLPKKLTVLARSMFISSIEKTEEDNAECEPTV